MNTALEALFLDSTDSDAAQGISAEERAHLDTLGEFVAVYVDEETMVGAGVYAPKTGGFRLIVKDLDCGLCLPCIAGFVDFSKADAAAKKAVGHS